MSSSSAVRSERERNALVSFVSIKLAIKNLINNPFSSISLAPLTRQILEFANDQVKSSEEISRNLLLRTTSRYDLEIKTAVSKLLHIIRTMEAKHAPSGSSVRHIEFAAEEVEDLKRDVNSFAEFIENLCATAPAAEDEDGEGEEEEEGGVSSEIELSVSKSKVIGFSDHYKELKHHLILPASPMVPIVLVLVGMAGIGKTTLAQQIFEDPDVAEHYDLRIWVKIGRKCRLKEIPRRILGKLAPNLSDKFLTEGDDREIARCLLENLEGKMYLIALDDVWNKYIANHFRWRSDYKILELDPFPYEGNGSRIMITTRLQQADDYGGQFPDCVLKLRLLNKDESWELLREKVFGEEPCSSQFEKAGRKIAESCEGLPLMIIKVADLLSTEERDLQYWNDVAAEKNHELFVEAYDEISKVFYSSYENLSHLVKMCFLYMGVFPKSYEIARSKLIIVWSIDGFLETNSNKFGYASAEECLIELVSNSLVRIYRTNLSPNSVVGDEQIKTCGLHSCLWHLSNREARETKFCCVLIFRDDGLGSDVEGQSRLSFHNNVLFGIKDVYESVENSCASSARSLLCYGPYHQYPVPMFSGLKFLRELDALTLHFYEFPLEVLEFVQLRYLALTLNGELPHSISRLLSLQFLIVGRQLRIRSCKGPSYLPLEIWGMKELKHIQVMDSELPNPNPCGASLQSLLTLSNVGAYTCTEEVLGAIPNLEKLGIRIDLAYDDDDGKLLSCLRQVSSLKELKTLKCVIMSSEIVPPLAPLPNFPSNLTKLSLSGLRYPWEETSKLASLLSLEVLKLRDYAFQGPKWEVKEGFGFLHSLEIEDTDLVEWNVECDSLKSLKSLSLKHCYDLEKIRFEYDRRSLLRMHWAFHNSLRKIEIVDCNPLGAEEMNKALPRWKKDAIAVHCSWDDTKHKR